VRILSIDSSLGTQLAVVDAAPSAAGARALQVLSQDEQADTRRHAESLGQMLSRALSAPEAAERPLDVVVAATGPAPPMGPPTLFPSEERFIRGPFLPGKIPLSQPLPAPANCPATA